MNKNNSTLIISSYDDLKNPVYSGGGAYSVHQLAKRLARNHNVSILTGTYKNAKDETIDNVLYTRIGSDIFGHKIGQILYQFALLKHVYKNNYDLWIESSTPPFTFSLLPKFTKRPVLSWIHMIASYDMQRKYKFNFRFLERELGKLYKYFVSPTDWVKKEIKTINKNAYIFTIEPGFEKELFKKSIIKKPQYGNYILYLGRIEIDQKGLDLLLYALKETKSKIKLIIAGDGSVKEKNILHKLIEDLKIKDKVIQIGRIQGVKKELLLKNAKAVIVPSRFETFSITALEALMYHTPLICFDIPQLKWIPQDLVRKISPFDIDKLASEIDNIGTFPPVIKKYKKFLEKFSWENTAKKFESCISQILNEK